MAEAGVAHRAIGQEGFGFSQRDRPRSTLDEIAALIEWEHRDAAGAAVSGDEGRAGLAAARDVGAMLLAVWYDPAAMKLADALDDRASFRRFYGFSAIEATPERTAFVRFRQLLLAHGPDRALLDMVTAQPAAKAITVKTGTIVDARS